jgi:hypothetical protein
MGKALLLKGAGTSVYSLFMGSAASVCLSDDIASAAPFTIGGILPRGSAGQFLGSDFAIEAAPFNIHASKN